MRYSCVAHLYLAVYLVAKVTAINHSHVFEVSPLHTGSKFAVRSIAAGSRATAMSYFAELRIRLVSTTARSPNSVLRIATELCMF